MTYKRIAGQYLAGPHGHGHGGGHHGRGWGGGYRGGWYGPAYEYAPDYVAADNGRLVDCFRDDKGNVVLGVPATGAKNKRGKCLIDAGGNIIRVVGTLEGFAGLGESVVAGLGSIGFNVGKALNTVALRAPAAKNIPTSAPPAGWAARFIRPVAQVAKQPLPLRPVASFHYLRGLGAAPADVAAGIPADSSGAPAGSKVITAGLAVDMTRGDIWFNGSRIPIIPAVISAVVVKAIMFGGATAGNYARAAAAKRFAKAPAT